MSVIDDILEALKGKKTPQETSLLIEQIMKEKTLYEAFKSAGLTSVTPEDVQARSRIRPEGIMSLIEKVNLIDLITKISLIENITTIGNVTNIASLDLLDRITLIDNITTIGTVNQITKILEARLIQDKSAIEGTDIDIYGVNNVANNVATLLISYFVPTDKTLLIYDYSACFEAENFPFYAWLTNNTLTVDLSVTGQNAGFQTAFSKPKRLASGEELVFYVKQKSGVAKFMDAHIGGVLI